MHIVGQTIVQMRPPGKAVKLESLSHSFKDFLDFKVVSHDKNMFDASVLVKYMVSLTNLNYKPYILHKTTNDWCMPENDAGDGRSVCLTTEILHMKHEFFIE